jgi:hypothetical protein
MIFKGLKRKSSQKFLERVLSKKNSFQSTNNGRIEKIGCIIDAEIFNNFDAFSNLASQLDVRNYNLSIVCYHNDDSLHDSFNRNMFSDKDFGWKGSFKDPGLQQFTANEYDLLINFYDDPNKLPLQLLTAQTNASFKVGFSSLDVRLNDLVISADIKNYDNFKEEMLKYLKILKKI